MPAANSMATQDAVLNSGVSSSPPSLMSPYLEKPMTTMNTKKNVHSSRKNQSSAVSE